MTDEELSRFYYLRKEIEDIDHKITELEETGGISGVRYKEVDVMATPMNKSILDKLDKLIDLWKERRVSAIEEYLKIERYINNINDIEIQRIMRYRYLDLMKWKDIDKLMHYGTNYSKNKYYNYRKML